MATCKDCLHFDACVDMLQVIGFTVDGTGHLADKRCRIFKDKTEYKKMKRGHWIRDEEYDICSECNQPVIMNRNAPDTFCKHCGAKNA